MIKKALLTACAMALAAASATGTETTTTTTTTVRSTVDDSALTAKVKAALMENSTTKANQIDVETEQGVVQLNGFVETANQKQAAEMAAKSVAGVSVVENNLQLRSGERSTGDVVDDSTITSKVKTALISDPRTKANQVEVKTYKGVVSLGGFVSSEAEKTAAESVAQSVDGVIKVQNGIAVGK